MTRTAASRAADRHAARHEAAHAVVAARLGLPLVYTDIIEHGTGWGARSGRTRLGRAAETNLTALATVAAAGIVAEGGDWDVPFTAPAAHDVLALGRIAQRLGVLRDWKDTDDDPAFGPWAMAAVRRARTRLRRDGGAAWRRVTAALLHDNRVLGAAVYLLVQRRPRQAHTPRRTR